VVDHCWSLTEFLDQEVFLSGQQHRFIAKMKGTNLYGVVSELCILLFCRELFCFTATNYSYLSQCFSSSSFYMSEMVALTNAICWKTVVKSTDSNQIGVVIYQKPVSNSCYPERMTTDPPLCPKKDSPIIPW
jgi:Putative S-adenosyl-L-methionine-dependent methyltransferase